MTTSPKKKFENEPTFKVFINGNPRPNYEEMTLEELKPKIRKYNRRYLQILYDAITYHHCNLEVTIPGRCTYTRWKFF